MELSRCKHCGGEATVQEETNIIQNYYGFSCWQVKCLSCGIRTGYGKKQEVIDVWNADPPIKTNYDSIKLMSISDLAKFVTQPLCKRIDFANECVKYKTCTECYESWLNREVKIDD